MAVRDAPSAAVDAEVERLLVDEDDDEDDGVDDDDDRPWRILALFREIRRHNFAIF